MSSSGSKRAEARVRPHVRDLHAYVPGEQPRRRGLIKLNTNENPFPPSPRVRDAVREAVDGRLRLYPNPTAGPLREALARRHGCRPDNILVGNGSDELLALATRAFVSPVPDGRSTQSGTSAQTIQFFHPSYSLYPVLADIHHARVRAFPLGPDFALPSTAALRRDRRWDIGAALTYITTPHAPSGRGIATRELERLCRLQKGVVILDEAYADFAGENAMELALRYPHVLVSRTFSKGYSLCFQRVGYFVGSTTLIQALNRLRDSYNVNGLGQVAALATLRSRGYYTRNFRRIIRTRDRVATALEDLGFRVLPSQTNFLLAEPPGPPAEEWQARLKRRGFLVRWFPAPEVRSYLRITIGTDAEMDAFLAEVRRRWARTRGFAVPGGMG